MMTNYNVNKKQVTQEEYEAKLAEIKAKIQTLKDAKASKGN